MNYPNGIKLNVKSTTRYGNRGMTLENDLNQTNKYYRDNDIAIIYKKPTPITINKVNYPSRDQAVIKEAHFKTPSTTDYNGIYKGKYIDFEAKETKLKTYFPLSNIHPHQIEHLKKIIEHGGIGFLIIRFCTLNVTYLLLGQQFFDFLKNNKRKSIPVSFFITKGFVLKDNYLPRIDYLKIIDQLYFKGD